MPDKTSTHATVVASSHCTPLRSAGSVLVWLKNGGACYHGAKGWVLGAWISSGDMLNLCEFFFVHVLVVVGFHRVDRVGSWVLLVVIGVEMALLVAAASIYPNVSSRQQLTSSYPTHL